MLERVLIITMMSATLSLGGIVGWQLTHPATEPEPDYSIPDVVLKVAKSNVVQLSLMGGTGTCSATVVNKKYLLTAGHCVPEIDPKAVAVTPRGLLFPMALALTGKPVFATHIYKIDAAVANGDLSSFADVNLDQSEGDVYRVKEAVLCGFPLFGKTMRCTRAKRVKNSIFAALFDVVAVPGQSGGAVFSLSGKLIGIIHSVTDEGYTQTASTAGVLGLDQL